ncbi:MAG: hypothetical protein H0W45_11550 [Acidobacteria bacterium]|jgi:hypothetical protein|nr:hypothetical protein [Acidobacteriota bacterium]
MKIIGYALCLNNADYEMSLDVRKVYPIIEPEENNTVEGFIRIIDESGEDYLYSDKRFAVINLSPQIEKEIKKSLALI